MVPHRRQLLIAGLKATDLLAFGASFAVATLLVLDRLGGKALGEMLVMRISVRNGVLVALVLALCHALAVSCGLYSSRRMSSTGGVLRDVVKATSLAALLIAAAGVLFSIELVTPLFLAAFWTLATASCSVVRLALRSVLVRVRIAGRNLRSVLIVGANPESARFAAEIEAERHLGYRVIGFADDPSPARGAFEAAGRAVMMSLADVPAWLRDNVADEVAIAMPFSEMGPGVRAIVAACEEQGVIVRLVSSALFDLRLSRARFEEFHGEAVITISRGAMTGPWMIVKRCVDVSLSLALLVSLSPVFLAVALGVLVTDGRPVIFSQTRVGLNKRRFFMYKFRTMAKDAEARLASLEHLNEADGAAFKIKDDPRVTPLGRKLRRLSLDELPQLVNVLAGDMSLVGPRPLPLRDVAEFREDWHRRRFSVRPGVTGLWQVSGRSSVSFQSWMQMDMWYIDQWSVWLDIKILAKTIVVALRGTGAA